MHLVIAPPTVGIDRQRMVKVGNYESGSNFSIQAVTGWASDLTYPSVVVSHRLVVAGAGAATVTAVLDSQTNDAAKVGAIKLTHNDTIIATGDLSAYNDRKILTITVSDVTVAEGDTIWLQSHTGSAVGSRIFAGSYLEVAST